MGFNYHEITTDMTKQLCRYIKELKFEDIPPFVIERTKMCVMQTIGVSLCSTQLQQIKDVIDIAKIMSTGSGEGGATLWGDGAKVSWEAATLAAGAMGDMLDWEDCSVTGHPSAGVIPMAIIGGEVLKKSGKEVLTAIVAGYEIYQRIASAGRGNIAGCNLFGNLAVLMKLMDLSEQQMNQAFGIGTACAIIPANVHEATMSDGLNYLYGFRNTTAVTMVKTALMGIENMEDALDDPPAYLRHMPNPKPEWVTKNLGQTYLMMNELLIKHWPANVFVQTYAELAYRLVSKYQFDPDEIEEIILDPSVPIRHWYTDTGYQSATQAQFSIPYGVACCMYHPEPGTIWYQPETMNDPKIISLLNRVKAASFVEMDIKGRQFIRDLIDGKHPEKRMTVRMKDGTEYPYSLFTHPGHPSYMLTREEFEDRFRLETKYVLSPEKADAATRCIEAMDRCGDLSELTQYLY